MTKEEYTKAMQDMLEDCMDWDSQTKALVEAFDQGIDYKAKKQVALVLKLSDKLHDAMMNDSIDISINEKRKIENILREILGQKIPEK